jgi:hypothetical protein
VCDFSGVNFALGPSISSAKDKRLNVRFSVPQKWQEPAFHLVTCQKSNINNPLWVVILTMWGCFVELAFVTWLLGNHQLC